MSDFPTAEAIDKIQELVNAGLDSRRDDDGQTYFPDVNGNSITWKKVGDPSPLYIRAKPSFEEAASFGEYVKEFLDHFDDKTQVFASVINRKFVAVLDYHSPETGAARAAHTATFSPRFDGIFEKWMKVNGKPMSQGDFAKFIEEHAIEIIAPDGATMLEVATDLDFKVDIKYASKKNLANGMVELVYTESSANGPTTSGGIAVPKELMVRMPIFFGEQPRQFKVFLRLVVARGEPLKFQLDIHRLDDEVESTFMNIGAGIEAITGRKAKLGTPSGV